MSMVEHTVYEISSGRVISWGNGIPLSMDGYGWIPGQYHGDQFRIVGGQPVPREAPTIPIDKAKAKAKSEVVDVLNWKASEVTGSVPESERSTWDAKEAAATATNPTEKQLRLLEIEAALVGETVEVTKQKIISNASLFYIMGPALTGIRRKCFKMIETAVTPEEVEAAISLCSTLWDAIVADPLGFSQKPNQFLNSIEG